MVNKNNLIVLGIQNIPDSKSFVRASSFSSVTRVSNEFIDILILYAKFHEISDDS